MKDDDFLDFVAFWEFFNPFNGNEEYECPYCRRVIKGNDKVIWVDKKKKIFKCPDCNEEIKIE